MFFYLKKIKNRILIIFTLFILIFTVFNTFYKVKAVEINYWVWRNSDMNYPFTSSNLILYQGNIDKYWNFRPLGVKPVHLQTKEITLLLRLYTLGDVNDIANLYNELSNLWKRYGVDVIGLQIDYDSPSARLEDYALWLNELTPLIKETLSVTSLLTYVNDNPIGLQKVAKQVDHIAMQLYHGFSPHYQYKKAIQWLNTSNINYKLGITTSEEFDGINQECQSYCQGINVFLNLVK